MVNYQNGKIYRMIIGDYNYIGSTVSTLSHRKGQHVNSAKTHADRLIYIEIAKIGWNNVKMILIELYPCESKNQLEAREQYWIDKMKSEYKLLNCKDAYLEYRELGYNTPEYQKEHNKKRHQKLINKDPEYYKRQYQKRLVDNVDFCKDNYQKLLVKCPICSCKIRKGALFETHMIKCHSPNYTDITKITQCPTCDLVLKKKSLNSHIKNKHPN